MFYKNRVNQILLEFNIFLYCNKKFNWFNDLSLLKGNAKKENKISSENSNNEVIIDNLREKIKIEWKEILIII